MRRFLTLYYVFRRLRKFKKKLCILLYTELSLYYNLQFMSMQAIGNIFNHRYKKSPEHMQHTYFAF
jgi:hypothetical protein